jgi:Asp-tRNA(Asn)/Glu-tRNA(Gln) amidotransferase A subunit family amidase
LALFVVACAGTGEPAPTEGEDPPPSAAVDPDAAAKLVRQGRTRVHEPHRRGGYVVRSLNMTVEAKDTAAALERARRRLEDLGATVQNVSNHEQQGSLNAVIPPGSMADVRYALASVGQRVVSENMGRSDQTSAYNEARRRLDRIELARQEVIEALKRASDPDAADGLGLLLELTAQERRNLINQLASYRQQAEGVQIYLSINAGEMLPEG